MFKRKRSRVIESDDDEEVYKGLPKLDEEDDKGGSDEEDKKDFVLAMKSALMKKKRRTPRSEAAKDISEFGLSSSGRDERTLFMDKISPALRRVDEKLADKIKSKLDAKVKTRKETKVLEVPMEKPHAEKIKRETLYEEASKQMNRWNETVYRNRSADQIFYPLGSNNKLSRVERAKERAANDESIPETDFEKDLYKILYGEDALREKLESKKPKDMAIEDYNMAMEEAVEKHNEMAKLRALQSYQATKARRQNKIKSKKYHRLLKREKIKKTLKEFEELKKNDPEGALDKLNELERSRVEERMNLKHRNTSKWAKMQSVRAKYNKDARIALKDQLEISRKLTQKVQTFSSSSEDEDVEEGPPSLCPYSEESQPHLRKLRGLLSGVQESSPEPEASIENNEKGASIIDPMKFIKLGGKSLKFNFEKDPLEASSDSDDDEDGQRMAIAEAFEDDDVIVNFQKKKEEELDASKPKEFDLTLPGWGEWGGKGLKPSQKKRKRFLIKAPKGPPRRDAKLPHVIYNEKAEAPLADHQVKQLPFPFQRVKDFEKIIRAPVGRTWLPELAMKDQIAPKVITKLGRIIQPLDEDVLENPKKIEEQRRKLNPIKDKKR